MKNARVIKRGAICESPEGEKFQMVQIEINFFGHISSDWYDTRIVNGIQTVIDGDGFIPNNYEVLND